MMETTDRYKALGLPYPDPKTVCKGQCEGIGRVPIHLTDADPAFRQLWLDAEREQPAKDGWHFVVCPECNGTGKR